MLRNEMKRLDPPVRSTNGTDKGEDNTRGFFFFFLSIDYIHDFAKKKKGRKRKKKKKLVVNSFEKKCACSVSKIRRTWGTNLVFKKDSVVYFYAHVFN